MGLTVAQNTWNRPVNVNVNGDDDDLYYNWHVCVCVPMLDVGVVMMSSDIAYNTHRQNLTIANHYAFCTDI